MQNFEEKIKKSLELTKSRNYNTSIHNLSIKPNQTYKNKSIRSSLSSGEIDFDKQENISMKKLMNATKSHISMPKLSKINRNVHIISLNKKLTNDLNYQINSTNKKIFGNLFSYKQTVNLQEINDFFIYKKTKKSIAEYKKTGEKNTSDFRMPILYRRMDYHYKKEDLVPIRMKPKINLMDVLYLHNRVFRKSMSQNNCKKYYLKYNMKLMKQKTKFKFTNKNISSNISNK
jgi:hypothetical protein